MKQGQEIVIFPRFCLNLLSLSHNWYDIARSATIGSSAASFLLEHKGPHGFGTQKQIQMRIHERRIIPSHFENTVKNNNF